jgi:hypothetical protein
MKKSGYRIVVRSLVTGKVLHSESFDKYTNPKAIRKAAMYELIAFQQDCFCTFYRLAEPFHDSYGYMAYVDGRVEYATRRAVMYGQQHTPEQQFVADAKVREALVRGF